MRDARDVGDSKSELFERKSEPEDTEDSDDGDDDSGFDNALRDMIPGVKVKVVKVTTPEKADRDLISKVIEQIIDREEEEDTDSETIDGEDETDTESDEDHDDIGIDASSGTSENDGQTQIAVEVVVGDGFFQNILLDTPAKELLRVPARLERKGRLSFTITVDEDSNDHVVSGNGQSPKNKRAELLSAKRYMDILMVDLEGDALIPKKVSLNPVCLNISLIFA